MNEAMSLTLRNLFLMICVAGWSFANAANEEREMRGAILRALPLLESSARSSAEQRTCFTCHHQAVPVFALQEAQRKGFVINEDNLDHLVQRTAQHLKNGANQYRQGKGQGGASLTAGYALWTLQEANWEPDTTTEAVTEYLLIHQQDKAYWHHDSKRPPSAGSDYTATYAALRGLTTFANDSQKPRLEEKQERIRSWAHITPPRDTEDAVFRLALLDLLEEPQTQVQEAIEDLISLQNETGGWSQNASLSPDAYATATAIMALLKHGDLSPSSEVVAQGIHYLLNEQQADGSWHVVTRAEPFQEYYESGFPYGNDQFISMAATAWAVYALALALPHSHESPRIESFDRHILALMKAHGIPGAAIAVTDHGRLVHAQGYGLADVETHEPVHPHSLFRIASLSKPITAVAILQLVEQGKLSLDSRVFNVLDCQSDMEAAGEKFDLRQKDITIEQLLEHRGGWDRNQSFDAMFQSLRFARERKVSPPAGFNDIIHGMMRVPLDFAPGERYAYSNYGYSLLGRVIEKVSGEKYEAYVQTHILKPLGITQMRLGKTRLEERAQGEVRYYHSQQGISVFDPNESAKVPHPYGAWCLETMDSHGGWIASAPDLVRFAAAFDDPDHSPLLKRESIERMGARPVGLTASSDKADADVYYSLGWNNRVLRNGKVNHWHTGSLPGTLTVLIRRHDGKNFAALLNTRESTLGGNLGSLLDQLLHRAANEGVSR